MSANEWGTKEWNNDHFPEDQLDSTGDTWGMRWQGMDRMRHRSYLKLVNDELHGTRSLRVLDIGCALCDFTEKAWKLEPNNRFWGMDISDNAIAWVSKKFPMFNCEVGALPDIPFDIEFDLVFCLEVICYVNAQERMETIDNIHRVLAPSGMLMFSGCLDGGRQHHIEEEVIGLIQRDFEIRQIMYNHWWLHRKLIRDPLDRVRIIIGSLLQTLELSNDEFNEFRSGKSSAVKLTVLNVLRPGNPVSIWLLRAILLPIKPIIGSRHLAVAFHWVSKVTRGSKKADEIVVLAVKKQGAPR